jgi:hypothetical protein
MFSAPTMDMKKRMRSKRKQQQGTILDELVFEILIRLPVKSLVRFKAVSKAWQVRMQVDKSTEVPALAA